MCLLCPIHTASDIPSADTTRTMAMLPDSWVVAGGGSLADQAHEALSSALRDSSERAAPCSVPRQPWRFAAYSEEGNAAFLTRKDSHIGKSSVKGWVWGGMSAIAALGRQRGRRIAANSRPTRATQ